MMRSLSKKELMPALKYQLFYSVKEGFYFSFSSYIKEYKYLKTKLFAFIINMMCVSGIKQRLLFCKVLRMWQKKIKNSHY